MTAVAIPSNPDSSEPPKKAAIIDDAFDPVTENEIPFSSFRAFLQIANEDSRLADLLKKIGVDYPDVSNWDDDSPDYLEFLRNLWQQRNDPDFRPLIDIPQLFEKKLGKLKVVEALCENIEKQHIAIERFDSLLGDLEQFREGAFVYIFIDYRLGVTDGEEAVKKAKAAAKKIYDLCPKEKRPVTILMSADPSVDDRVKDEFRKEGMLEGVIRFSPKDDLKNKGKVSLLIKAYGEEFASNHILQEYIQTLGAAAKLAQEEFGQEIMALTIEDYEYLQSSILKFEGQPLGNYLGWLYGSHWANLLFKNPELKTKQENIDRVISQKLPLHHSVPSDKLSKIFMTAMFETDLENLSYHPLAQQFRLPYLHLGDIFTKDAAMEIFMVLNPQCDLERPSEKKKNQSILLIPGTLILLDNKTEDRHPQTEFFVYDKEMYRIVWNVLNLTTVVYHEFEGWVQKNELERKFRLRLPFALDIQQQFTSNMSRIGLPVVPPMSHTIFLEMYLRNHEGILVPVLGRSNEFAFLPLTREADEKARFTLKFALDFKDAIIGQLEEMTRLKGNFSTPTPKLDKIIDKLQGTINDFDDWFFNNRSFNYPKITAQSLKGLSISTILNSSVEALKDERKFNSLFIINIIDVNEERAKGKNSTEDGNKGPDDPDGEGPSWSPQTEPQSSTGKSNEERGSKDIAVSAAATVVVMHDAQDETSEEIPNHQNGEMETQKQQDENPKSEDQKNDQDGK